MAGMAGMAGMAAHHSLVRAPAAGYRFRLDEALVKLRRHRCTRLPRC